MRVRRVLTTMALLLCLLPGTALAQPHLNAYSLQGQFICVSCHEPLNQVNSPESQAEKQNLSQLVDQGLTLSQIKTQMVRIYGEDVLAQPPADGINLLVYILPPLLLVCGLGYLGYSLPRWRRRGRDGGATAAALNELPLASVESDRLEQDLVRFGR